MTEAAVELKPCPFCGNEASTDVGIGEGEYMIFCPICLAQGPPVELEMPSQGRTAAFLDYALECAAVEWNKREKVHPEGES